MNQIVHPSNFIPAGSDHLYREMAEVYREACRKRPLANRALTALAIGSRFFDVEIALLQGEHRNFVVTDVRHRIMAFSRVVSAIDQPLISYPAIGRAFNRDHATAMYAFSKYGQQIAGALR